MEESLNPVRRGAFLLALLSVSGGVAGAGRLLKVWEFKVGKEAQPSKDPASSPPHVYALSFSPDGQRVAAVVGESTQQESLVFINTAGPDTNGARYDLRSPIAESEEISMPAISWSVSGEAIALGSFVFTSDGRTCQLPPSQFLFFGATHAAGVDAAVVRYHTGNVPWHLLFFHAECQDVGTWEIPYDRYISDASADRGLLCLLPFGRLPLPRKSEQLGPVEVLVVSPSDRSVVHRWNIQVMNRGVFFADSGKALCGLDGGSERHGAAHCWGVDSGKEIAATKGLNVHPPMRTALHAQRAVLSQYSWQIDLEGFYARMGALKKRLIWDFGTGRELASWKPNWQRARSAAEREEPFKFAISPDGTHLIEGGDGVLILYKIEP
jgi:hypothetical protein